MVRKDHRPVRGRLCLAFPDAYTIGMSHHGLQVLYSLMNARDDWACERAFTPWLDMEQQLRAAGLPLYSLETFTPLAQFDVLGFHAAVRDRASSNILTMLDLGGIPLRADRADDGRSAGHCRRTLRQNPEPLAPFIDVFVTGDGEPSLPRICDLWLELQDSVPPAAGRPRARPDAQQREEMLAALAANLPFCYVPRFYEPEYRDGRLVGTESHSRPTCRRRSSRR